jgi:hypothetical protein
MAPPRAESQPSILALSPQGQKALIDALSNTQSASNLFSELAQNFARDDSSSLVDKTKFHKRIVVSVADDPQAMLHPADRISDITITLSDLKNARFESWDRFSTQYDTVDLGKLSLAQTSQLALKLSGQAPAPAAAGGSIDYTASHNQNEEVSLRQRYVVLTGTLTEDRATLTEQGVVGIDLIGTSTIDVDVTVPALAGGEHTVALGALSERSKWLPQNKITLNWQELRVPRTCDPVTFMLSARYVIRRVQRNADTITESDDKVVFLSGNTSAIEPIELITSGELKSLVWHLVSRGGDEVGLLEGGGPLHFGSYDSATQFLTWLNKRRSLELADRTLYLGLRRLCTRDIPALSVESIPLNNCRQ